MDGPAGGNLPRSKPVPTRDGGLTRASLCGAKPWSEGAHAVRRWPPGGHEVHPVYRKQLDLDTLVCTRGPNFPLSRLESRLMCPANGSHRVTIVFEPPTNREVRSG
jgi:hypothetical protein